MVRIVGQVISVCAKIEDLKGDFRCLTGAGWASSMVVGRIYGGGAWGSSSTLACFFSRDHFLADAGPK